MRFSFFTLLILGRNSSRVMSHFRGSGQVAKLHLMRCIAYNHGCCGETIGAGKPKVAADASGAPIVWLYGHFRTFFGHLLRLLRAACDQVERSRLAADATATALRHRGSSTR